MMTILILFGVFCVSAIGLLVFQASRAPEGHEDAEGFHFAPQSAPRRAVREIYVIEQDHEVAAHGATRHIPAT